MYNAQLQSFCAPCCRQILSYQEVSSPSKQLFSLRTQLQIALESCFVSFHLIFLSPNMLSIEWRHVWFLLFLTTGKSSSFPRSAPSQRSSKSSHRNPLFLSLRTALIRVWFGTSSSTTFNIWYKEPKSHGAQDFLHQPRGDQERGRGLHTYTRRRTVHWTSAATS